MQHSVFVKKIHRFNQLFRHYSNLLRFKRMFINLHCLAQIGAVNRVHQASQSVISKTIKYLDQVVTLPISVVQTVESFPLIISILVFDGFNRWKPSTPKWAIS